MTSRITSGLLYLNDLVLNTDIFFIFKETINNYTLPSSLTEYRYINCVQKNHLVAILKVFSQCVEVSIGDVDEICKLSISGNKIEASKNFYFYFTEHHVQALRVLYCILSSNKKSSWK